MSAVQHTPGPWRRVHSHPDAATRRDLAYITAPGFRAPCAIATIYGCAHQPEQAANANLIAAAPELLAALRKAEDILSRVDQHSMGPPGFQTANEDALIEVRAALAKAVP